MSKAVKIAISLPAEVLDAAEREREVTGETRSQFFRRAVETLLRRERTRAAIERYMQSYRESPESAEEIGAATILSTLAFSQEPWE